MTVQNKNNDTRKASMEVAPAFFLFSLNRYVPNTK